MTTRETSETTAARQQTSPISDVTFVKVGGLVAIVAPFVFIGALISGTEVANNSLDLLGHLLYFVVILVLYHLFRDGGATMRFAAVVGILGLLFITLNDFIALASVELAAQTATAGEATKPALDAVTTTGLVLRSHLEIVGNVLAWGVGGGVFSLAILRTERVSKWVGLAGVLFAVLMWASLFEVMFTTGGIRDAMVFFVGNFFGRLWLVLLGISLVRVDDSVIP